MPKVSIVIPNFDGRKFIERCLSSLMKTSYPNFEVIIVDDGSTDDSVEIAERLYGSDSRLKIICTGINRGAAASRNVGIAKSHGEIITVLDNDTKVNSRWLKELVKVMQSDSTIGAVQSKMVTFNGKRISCAGEKIIPYLGWPMLIGAYEEDEGQYDKVMNILGSGGALAFKREVADKIRGFDSKLPHIQFEDLDFSWRVWLAGYKVVLAPKSIVYHEGSQQPLTRNQLKRFSCFVQRNCIRVLIKNYSLKSLLKYLPTSIAGMWIRALFHVAKKNDPCQMTGLLKAIFWNLSNLHDTMKERNRIQYLVREVSDKYIMKHVGVWLSPLRIYREFLTKGRI